MILLRVERDSFLHDFFHVSAKLLEADSTIIVRVSRIKYGLPELSRVLHHVVIVAVAKDTLNVFLLEVT